MNERIKALAIEAKLISPEFNGFDRTSLSLAQQKFAKLIVKECCEVAHYNFHVDGLTLGVILKEHFGVEE